MTVGNTGLGPNFEAASGAGYRQVADMAEDPPGLWTVDGQGQSGHPASAHYRDQYEDWLAGRLHFLPIGHTAPVDAAEGESMQTLLPLETAEG